MGKYSFEKIKGICHDFLSNCTGYEEYGRGFSFIINGNKISLQRFSPLFHYRGMSELCITAFKEKWDSDMLADKMYKLHQLVIKNKRTSPEVTSAIKSIITDDGADTNEQLDIEDELREALGGYGILTDQIMQTIVPVLKKHGSSKDDESIKKLEEAEERIKRLEKVCDGYSMQLQATMDVFYNTIFKKCRIVSYSSKFLTPFKGYEPIAKILDFYGIHDTDNKRVATLFNIGIQKSGLAYKTKDNGRTEWEITPRAKIVTSGTYAGITNGVIVNCSLVRLDEKLGHELYFNYDAFCCFIDCMRQDGTVNYDVMNELGLWNKTDK